jgi:hypothetical protein
MIEKRGERDVLIGVAAGSSRTNTLWKCAAAERSVVDSRTLECSDNWPTQRKICAALRALSKSAQRAQ